MRQGGGVEVVQDGIGGDSGEQIMGFPGIWTPTYLSIIVKVPLPYPVGLVLYVLAVDILYNKS